MKIPQPSPVTSFKRRRSSSGQGTTLLDRYDPLIAIAASASPWTDLDVAVAELLRQWNACLVTVFLRPSLRPVVAHVAVGGVDALASTQAYRSSSA